MLSVKWRIAKAYRPETIEVTCNTIDAGKNWIMVFVCYFLQAISRYGFLNDSIVIKKQLRCGESSTGLCLLKRAAALDTYGDC